MKAIKKAAPVLAHRDGRAGISIQRKAIFPPPVYHFYGGVFNG